MKQRFSTYPAYAPSPAEWQGDIPVGWRVLAVGRIFRRVKRTGFPEEQLLSVYRDFGVLPKNSRKDNYNKESEDLRPYQLVRHGELVLNKMKAWQGSIAISGYRGIVSPAYFVYETMHREDSRIITKYIHYVLRSPSYIAQFLRHSKGIRVNQWDLDPGAFERIEVLLPSPVEQTQIANFLDHETAKMDALIEKQQQLIALLKEKRQAVISHAVTKGLDPDVPMRDSGVEWLGEVPAHWEVVQLRRLLTNIEQGSSPVASANPPGLEEAGVLKISAVKRGMFDEDEAKMLDNAFFESAYRVRKGDLLVTRGNTPDRVAYACVVREEPKSRLMISDLIASDVDIAELGR